MNFAQFAHAHGLLVPDFGPSRHVQRCATESHPRSRNGAFLWDGRRGWVMRWDGDGEIHWYDDDKAPWSNQDKHEWRLRRLSVERERDQRAHAATLRAQMMIRDAKPANHAYLQYKGLKDVLGLVSADDMLLVPMRELRTDHLVGLQVIRWLPELRQYEKKMLPSMRAKGAVLQLGARTSALTVLCEGYVTGLSIKAATDLMRLNAAILICFSVSNLEHIAPMVKGKVVVFADNDASGAGEQAAKRTGLPYCMSAQAGEDANDVYYRAGPLAVGALLMQAM